MQHQKNTGATMSVTRSHPGIRSSSRATAAIPRAAVSDKVLTEREIAENVMNFAAEFFHRGKRKRAPRIELTIKRFGAAALKGDVGAAAMLLKLRAYFAKHGDTNVLKPGSL